MIDIYTKEDYAKSYTELIEILKYISKSDLNKIPKDKIKNYIKIKIMIIYIFMIVKKILKIKIYQN